MKRLSIRFEENGKTLITNKEALFLNDEDDLEIYIENFQDFEDIIYLKHGVPQELNDASLVLHNYEIEDKMELKFKVNTIMYTIPEIKVKGLKLVGGSLTDKYPETIVKILEDIEQIFHIIEDYGTIKKDIGALKKITSFLYEEVMEKDVIK